MCACSRNHKCADCYRRKTREDHKILDTPPDGVHYVLVSPAGGATLFKEEVHAENYARYLMAERFSTGAAFHVYRVSLKVEKDAPPVKTTRFN